jgi:putative membrane protein
MQVWLVVRATTTGSDKGGAREILAQRNARGEIDDQEYQQRLRILGS